jgi:hypothetical protein
MRLVLRMRVSATVLIVKFLIARAVVTSPASDTCK